VQHTVGETAPANLDELVTAVATQLMGVDSVALTAAAESVLRLLVDHFQVDLSFLRFHDPVRRATVLVAEWPRRTVVPDPDPLGVIFFETAEPAFAASEHMADVMIIRPDADSAAYQRRVRDGSGVAATSVATVPLRSRGSTTGTLGFIKHGDRGWDDDEIRALKTIAVLLAQMQARLLAEDQLRHIAHHDELTGLPNRRALLAHLQATLDSGESGQRALLFIDVDRLKAMNDFLGHEAGDRFIVAVADRLRGAVGPNDLVARLGGDEFVVSIAGFSDEAQAATAAARIQRAIAEPIRLGGQTLGRTVSVGIAVADPDISGVDGADRSGLTALTYAWMANYASDATLAVALANTLFFSAASAESKDKVALYLLITVAPFAVIAPVIGPALDRLQSGRRWALAGSTAAQGALAVVLALYLDTWVLYPAALGIMVLSKSFGVLKAAVTPRVLPPGSTLVTTNSRLTVFGLVASGVAGAIAAGVSFLFGSPGAAWLTAAVCGVGVWLCLRIPSWVEVTEGEVATTLMPTVGAGNEGDARPRVRLSRQVRTALWANGTIRSLTGFLMLFAAFVVKQQTEGSPGEQLVLLGAVGAAAGVGGFLGNAVGARQQFGHPTGLLVGFLSAALTATVVAAVFGGVATAAVVGLVGATASALLKVCLDAVVQRDMPEESRASAFGRSETVLQLSWVFGGALGVLLPPTWWIGFTVIAVVVGVGTVQTVLISRGSSMLPRRAPA